MPAMPHARMPATPRRPDPAGETGWGVGCGRGGRDRPVGQSLVAGRMFWFMWNRFLGSYRRLTSASRAYVSAG